MQRTSSESQSVYCHLIAVANVDNNSMTIPNVTSNEFLIRKGVKIDVLPGNISVLFTIVLFSKQVLSEVIYYFDKHDKVSIKVK